MRTFQLVARLTGVTLGCLSAQAGILGPATGYNAFVLNNMEAKWSSAGGRIAVGKNLTLSSWSIGGSLSGSTDASLVVGGNLKWTDGQLANGSGKVGGNINLKGVSSQNGKIEKGAPIDFDSAETQLKELSQYLDDVSANGITQLIGNAMTLIGTNSLLNVFDVSAKDMKGLGSFSISAPMSSTILINVSGNSVNWSNFAMSYGDDRAANVLFNLTDAKSLNVSSFSIRGSVLAPEATANLKWGDIHGTVIAKNLTDESWRFDNVGFTGSVSLPGAAASPVGTPEPGTWAMVGGAGALLVGFRSRKRKAVISPASAHTAIV